ncbi:MAG: ABC transporter substrate-binding protein [Chloroflexota bacterium]|nr:ABC transporter substrate-binding protein [Chloroflexota bacterium]
MDDRQIGRLFTSASLGRISRRQLLETGLRLGIATPMLTALYAAVPTAATASVASAPGRLPTRQAGDSGTLTILISVGTEDIDPHYSYTTLSSTVALTTYEMLIEYAGDSTDQFQPMLAESWEASADEATYTFKLYPEVTFHDGTACDAQAVRDAYTRFLLLEGGPVNVISRFVSDPEQMEVVDPTTLRFNLGKPQPLFLPAMASQYGPSVISPTAIEENKTNEDPYAHEWFTANAVGSGPYRLVENTLNERLVFERFEEFHRGWEGNHFEQIVFRVVPENATRRQLLEQGEADAAAYNLTVDDILAMKSNPAVQVVEYPSTAVTWAIMNVPRLKTPEVRQGFSYAFPYQEVIDGAYKGYLKRNGPIADSVRGYDPDVFLYETDLVKAKELIVAGGFAEGDSFDFMFDANDERDSTVAQLFQANVQEMGFTLELVGVDYATVESTIFGDAPPEERPMFISWGWWPDYNDPWNQLAPNFTEGSIGGGGGNSGAYVNPRFEEIMAEAEVYTDEAELLTLMKEAQNIVTEQDPPAIYYGQSVRYTVLGADIEGYYGNPLYLDAFPVYAMSRRSS